MHKGSDYHHNPPQFISGLSDDIKTKFPFSVPLSETNLPNFQSLSSSNIHIPPGKCDLKATKWHSTIVRNIRRNAPEMSSCSHGRGARFLSLFIDSSSGWFSIKSKWLPGKQRSRQQRSYGGGILDHSHAFAFCQRVAKFFFIKGEALLAWLRTILITIKSEQKRTTPRYP